MNEFERLGTEIKFARISNNLSQEKFAEMLNLSSTHIKHIESGHRKPSIEILFLIAQKLNMSIDNIIFDKLNIKSESDLKIDVLLSSCTEKEKFLICDIIQDVLNNR